MKIEIRNIFYYASSGSVAIKAVPDASSLSRRISPWCSAAMLRAMARPMPLPCVYAALSAR